MEERKQNTYCKSNLFFLSATVDKVNLTKQTLPAMVLATLVFTVLILKMGQNPEFYLAMEITFRLIFYVLYWFYDYVRFKCLVNIFNKYQIGT